MKQRHKITQADQGDFAEGTLMKDDSWGINCEEKTKNGTSRTLSRRKKGGIKLLLLENNFHLNRQKISFASSEWGKKASNESCWAWLKVGHSTVGVIDVTGATSTIRGELVDVRQCHCAQWNIHRSAFRPPFWLPGWLALIFLRLYTPLTIKRTYWVAHVTEGEFGGDTELGQATCKPNSRPQHPLVTSYLP